MHFVLFFAYKFDVFCTVSGITMLGRKDGKIKKRPGMPLKVKWRLGAVPKAYELTKNNKPDQINSVKFLNLTNPILDFN